MLFYWWWRNCEQKSCKEKKEGDCHDGPNQTGGNKIQLNLGCTHKLATPKENQKKEKKKRPKLRVS